MEKRELTKLNAIGGFPEWLPEERHAELQWMDAIRSVFESHGFCNIETPSVEEVDVLISKGETDKEIYGISRLFEDREQSGQRLGLHYDLTVPFARYVAQHYGKLDFPFRRYQIQRVWRGERPQEGRFREFYQCDIDIIENEKLPLHLDAQMVLIVIEALEKIGIAGFRFHVSNRKILEGYLLGLGITDTQEVIRVLDKLGKIGERGVKEMLMSSSGMDEGLIEKLLAISRIAVPDATFLEKVAALGVRNPQLDEGLSELAQLMEGVKHVSQGRIIADLSIARGFDYYTGSIYEVQLVDFPKLGSICSGGRYENLTGAFINRRLPGVGISIGLTRVFSKYLKEGLIKTSRKCPTDVLVAVPSDSRRVLATEIGDRLRARGMKVEVYINSRGISDQLKYASKKGIPFVWFPPFEDGLSHEVKDMRTGTQAKADPENWSALT